MRWAESIRSVRQNAARSAPASRAFARCSARKNQARLHVPCYDVRRGGVPSMKIRVVGFWTLGGALLVGGGLALFALDFPRVHSNDMAPGLRDGDLVVAC